uniref:Transmembrane protein 214-A n=1 Tax=Ananas comosus var. bracteatus TaxID=296719 RepID=A0A6V7Q4Q3_ANACO|nr:unnamed protein product [Ananas comosus var. bracteatus]
MDETKPAPFLDPALAADDDDDDDAALAAAVAASTAASAPAAADPNHGWQKVTYGKRQRRHQLPQAADPDRDGSASRGPDRSHVFASVEQRAHERRRALESAAAAAAAAAAAPSAAAAARAASSDEDDDDAAPHGAQENGGEAPKKIKQKKPKKPKITVAEAAAALMRRISPRISSRSRAFVGVSASQFPWAKMFKESPVSKIVDIPLSHISEPVYKTSVDWIGQKSPDALADFVLWCLDGVLADLASQQAAAKGSKKAAQQAPSRAQVAIFVVLAMTLRRKPDILISLLPKIRENSKYQGQEKLPLIVWVVAQASQGDLVVGMFAWAHYLFPNICGKSSGNPQSRDLVLQLVERLLSGPKARTILLNGAVRKGERLMPPAALDLLMRVTFPPSAAKVKATERFEAVYPTLKELALAGSPATKTTKQASQQILPSCIKAMQENNPELTKEAADIFIWCLTQNSDCYKQWEKLHLENVEASIVVLREILTEWKELSAKLSPDALRETVKNLKAKNEEALSATEDASKQGPIKEADKYCKLILGRLKSGFSCVKGSLIVLVVAAVVSFAMSPTIESLDWGKLHTVFSAAKSF